MTFPCEKCGACCRAIKCVHLKLNRCEIYEHRPSICRVDEMVEKCGFDKVIGYQMTKEKCELLRKEF